MGGVCSFRMQQQNKNHISTAKKSDSENAAYIIHHAAKNKAVQFLYVFTMISGFEQNIQIQTREFVDVKKVSKQDSKIMRYSKKIIQFCRTSRNIQIMTKLEKADTLLPTIRVITRKSEK